MTTDFSLLTILVTRPGASGEELCEMVTAAGGKAVHFPVIAFAPPADQEAFQDAINGLGEQEWVIFNSPQSVRAAVPMMRAVWPNFSEQVQFAAVGAGTAKALKEAGYLAALIPDQEWSSEGLLAMPALQVVSGKKITIVRGAGGRELLEKVLLERGAIVTSCLAYQRILPVVNAAACLKLIQERQLNVIAAGSFESVSNLLLLLGNDCWQELRKIPLIVMSERVKKLAAESGFQTIWVTQTASQQSVLDLILQKRGILMSEPKQEMNEENNSSSQPRTSGVGMVLTIIAFVIVGGAIAAGYLQLTTMNAALTDKMSALSQQVTEHQNTITTLKETPNTTTQETNATAAAQGDTSKLHIAEAQYLTKFAGYQLKLTRNAASAYVILQHAQDILQQVNNPALDPVRQALAANIASLNAAQQLNIDQVSGLLLAISNQIDNLPLPPTPLQYTEEATKAKNYEDAPWWKLQWHKTMDALRKIVIVRYTGSNEMPLILPEEKKFLYQNLHTELQMAQLGLLNHNASVYNASITQLTKWVEKYFVQDAPLTQTMLGQLRDAAHIENIEPPPVDIAATLQLFDQYLAQNGQPNPVVTP